MAVRSRGISLLATALALTTASQGRADVCDCQEPPSPRWSEAAAAGPLAADGVVLEEAVGAGCTVGDMSVHLLQEMPHRVQGGWQVDGVSLGRSLRGSLSVPPQLRFLHIPRTGGTSIEMANMLMPPGHEAFTSLFHDTMSCLQTTTYPGNSLVEIYNATHANTSQYTGLVQSNPCYQVMTIGHGPSKSLCVDYHYPPGYSTLLQTYYQQGPTFCSVREPSQRIFSALKVQQNTFNSEGDAINCTVPAYDDAITRFIQAVPRKPYAEGCFYVHQAEFAAYCQHVIHTETLGEEFAALMRSYGQNVTLPPWRVGDDWTDTCNIKLANLSHSTRQLLYEFLKEDYDSLGYPPPF